MLRQRLLGSFLILVVCGGAMQGQPTAASGGGAAQAQAQKKDEVDIKLQGGAAGA